MNTINNEPIGIWVGMSHYDSPDGYADAFLAFYEDPQEGDNQTLYYLSPEEVADLKKAIDEKRDRYFIEGNEWFVDLTWGYEYVYSTED